MTSPLHRLPYAAERRKRKLARWIFAGLVVALVAVGGWKLHQIGAWNRLALWNLQRQCLTYVAAEKPVSTPSASFKPFLEFATSRGTYIEADLPVAFLHERATANGERRLLAIRVSVMDQDHGVQDELAPGEWNAYVDVAAELWQPGSLHSDPVFLIPTVHGSPLSYITRGPSTVYYGAPDPNDPTHFTFKIENGGEWSTIDGWLRSDKRVDIKPRNGPAKKRPYL